MSSKDERWFEVEVPFEGFGPGEHNDALEYGLEGMFQDLEGNFAHKDLYERARRDIDWGKVYEAYAKGYVEDLAQISDITPSLRFERLEWNGNRNYRNGEIYACINERDLVELYESVDKNERENIHAGAGAYGVLGWDEMEIGELLKRHVQRGGRFSDLDRELSDWAVADGCAIEEYLAAGGGEIFEQCANEAAERRQAEEGGYWPQLAST